MRFCRSGLTLLEVLLAVSIVALLLALVLPILGSARARARESNCVTNLRQIYVVWKNYVDDYSEYPASLVPLISQTNNAVFRCPSDSWGGLNVWTTLNAGYAVSYFYAHSINDRRKRELLERSDPNHGIVFCVLHASHDRETVDRTYRRFRTTPEQAAHSTFPYPPVFEGKLLRLRVDGSVQQARISPRCYQLPDGVTLVDVNPWYYLTDSIPCLWCDTVYPEIPCR